MKNESHFRYGEVDKPNKSIVSQNGIAFLFAVTRIWLGKKKRYINIEYVLVGIGESKVSIVDQRGINVAKGYGQHKKPFLYTDESGLWTDNRLNVEKKYGSYYSHIEITSEQFDKLKALIKKELSIRLKSEGIPFKNLRLRPYKRWDEQKGKFVYEDACRKNETKASHWTYDVK